MLPPSGHSVPRQARARSRHLCHHHSATPQTASSTPTAAGGAPHPVLGALTFQQWIAFLGYHEARHAAQIRAVMHELAAR